MRRRHFLAGLSAAGVALPLIPSALQAATLGTAKRLIIFNFPDGVAGQSQSGEGSIWNPSGSEFDFQLSDQLEALAPWKSECVVVSGLSMGGTDAGSHPGGAKKLLTGVDGGYGESIDRYIARTQGAAAPHQMVYLGAMANHNNASGDKHISYVGPGVSVTPEDSPLKAFNALFGQAAPPGSPPGPTGPNPGEVTVIDSVLEEINALRAKLGDIEKAKLDIHLDALREVEKRIKAEPAALPMASTCADPQLDTTGIAANELYMPERFPHILRGQIDVLVSAMACGLTRVGTIQGSHHTSELIMSRFEGTEMYEPNYDMRSHQASHYGATHDWQKKEFTSFVKQRRWWVSQFAYLLSELAARPDGDQTMLDTSLVVMCSEVADGNTHSHDDVPFILAGRANGAISTGRYLQSWGTRHSNLLVGIARAMGQDIWNFGSASDGPLSGLLS